MNQKEGVPNEKGLMLAAGALFSILGGIWLQFFFRSLELFQIEAMGGPLFVGAGLLISTVGLILLYARILGNVPLW